MVQHSEPAGPWNMGQTFFSELQSLTVSIHVVTSTFAIKFVKSDINGTEPVVTLQRCCGTHIVPTSGSHDQLRFCQSVESTEILIGIGLSE